jgi:hypothetical protein
MREADIKTKKRTKALSLAGQHVDQNQNLSAAVAAAVRHACPG